MAQTSTWIWALAACSGPASDGASGSPSLWVQNTLIFDGVDIGTDEPAVEQVWVENVGHGTLFVEAPYFAEDGAFSVPGESVTLERMEAHAYDVTFDPQVPFVHEGSLVFESDDPKARLRAVDVRGEAFAPVLDVSTSAIDLGTAQSGCEVVEALEIRNSGNEVLVVSASLSGVVLDQFTVASDSDPMEIPPSMTATVALVYNPLDATPGVATLTLETNDPFLPKVVIQVAGGGQKVATQTDLFEVSTRASDIVLVVDNSPSMETEQPQLVDHIGTFVASLDAAEVDYRIGVISTDQSSFYGPVVTPRTKDPGGKLADQVTAMGTDGSGTGRALEMLYDCVQPGSDCSESAGFLRAGFLRDDALLVGIIFSDGPDQSTLSPQAYVESFWTLKDDPELVRILAIAGAIPIPTCSTCASAGFGYDEAVELTHGGGGWVDICADDMREGLAVIADQSSPEPPPSVRLSEDPVVYTIEVSVDGARWDGGWTYTGHVVDGGTNEVAFFDPLPMPSVVEVSYTVTPACE